MAELRYKPSLFVSTIRTLYHFGKLPLTWEILYKWLLTSHVTVTNILISFVDHYNATPSFFQEHCQNFQYYPVMTAHLLPLCLQRWVGAVQDHAFTFILGSHRLEGEEPFLSPHSAPLSSVGLSPATMSCVKNTVLQWTSPLSSPTPNLFSQDIFQSYMQTVSWSIWRSTVESHVIET